MWSLLVITKCSLCYDCHSLLSNFFSTLSWSKRKKNKGLKLRRIRIKVVHFMVSGSLLTGSTDVHGYSCIIIFGSSDLWQNLEINLSTKINLETHFH